MKYVLDASIAVAAARPSEALYRVAQAHLYRILRGMDEIVVPALFVVEVTSALARVGTPANAVTQYVEGLAARATLVTLGPKRMRLVAALALASKLRAADAQYVWVAEQHGLSLSTHDNEIVTRGAPYCAVDHVVP